jgi:hypothetical protein
MRSNAGMAIQTEGRWLTLRASRRPQLDLWLVGWNLVILHTYPPIKMGQCSETSAYKIQTPGNYPEESIQHLFTSFSENSKMHMRSLGRGNFEVSHPRCVDKLSNQKNILNIWSEHNYILLSHRLVYTTTCFGPVYWPSTGCIINLISSYTIYAWVLWWGGEI